MEIKSFRYKDQQREYIIFGNGPRVMYAFHGFGQSAAKWMVLEEWLASEFTVYSFFDFFHEESFNGAFINSERPLEKEDVTDYFHAFSELNKHAEINLMAFSSGARTLLTLIERPRIKIEEVWMFAPDGISISFWNALFCRYRIIQKIYRGICNHPTMFFNTLKFFNMLGIINRELRSFVLFSLRTKTNRIRVYNYWMKYSKIIPSHKEIIQNASTPKVKIHLIIGKEDSVINMQEVEKFANEYGPYADLLVLDGTHNIIDSKYAKLLLTQYARK